MLAQERYKKILQALSEEGSVKVSGLIKQFNVSIETVRRDLEYLEKEGFLKRVYGGAVLDTPHTAQITMTTRELEFIDEKREMAQTALNYIREGESIALNASTTTLELARALKHRIARLTVLTNSLLIANELSDAEQYTLILSGGIYQKAECSFNGAFAEKTIGEFYVDTAFVSVSGVSLLSGITDYDPNELGIQKQMIHIAQKAVVLADSSKFDVRSLLKLADLEDVNLIVTDSKIKGSILHKYRSSGIEVATKDMDTEKDNWSRVPQRW